MPNLILPQYFHLSRIHPVALVHMKLLVRQRVYHNTDWQTVAVTTSTGQFFKRIDIAIRQHERIVEDVGDQLGIGEVSCKLEKFGRAYGTVIDLA